MAAAVAEAAPEISSPVDAAADAAKVEWPEKTVPGPERITARTVLEDPKVTLFTNFLSKAECEHLLSLAEGRWERSTVTRGYASTLLDNSLKQSESDAKTDSEAKTESEGSDTAAAPAAATAGSAADEADASTTASTEEAAPVGPAESNKDKEDDRPTNALHVEPDQEEERVVGKKDASVVPQKGGVLQVESKNRTSCSVIFQYGESPVLEQILARVAMVTGRPLDCVERPVLVRYLPGQFFNEHHDGAVRPVTVFAYFNDVEGGGETYFPHLGFQVRPVAGTALMWPNINEDGAADMRMIHQGLPPEKGVKYGINLFVNAHSQRDVSHIRVVRKTPGDA
mmetsp:Transcript_151526/g.262539  ORF Transcript_151526/g.262539 Transcript_151526/m.262539 type:complete len:340 (+) Transcript_151526:61-1080(+)